MSEDYIFLSYSHRDTDRIQTMIDWLETNYHVWYDKNLGAAREYNEEIADQIRNSRIVIAFFSVSYMESPYCRDEIMYARTKGIEILGILIEEVQMSEGMQLRLGRFQMLSFGDAPDYDKIMANKLVQLCMKDAGKANLLQNIQNLSENNEVKQLPRMLFATDFEGGTTFSVTGEWKKAEGGTLRVPIGLRKDTDFATITEAYYDTAYGHQFICGSTMSGKSTLLQTILFQLMEHYAPDAIQLYLIDFGNYMLELLKNSPHVGDVMNREEKEKITRFFLYIKKELKQRIQFFRNGSYVTYSQKYGTDRPIILIAIDGFESFWDEYLIDEQNQEVFKAILREGMRAGILFLLGKGTTSKMVYGFSMENVRTLAALGYENLEKYQEAFQIFKVMDTEEKNQIEKENFENPGKGMLKTGKKFYIFQSALPVEMAEDYDRYDALAEKCQEMKQGWNGEIAKKVPNIPEYFTSEVFFKMDQLKKLQKEKRILPIGLNYYSAEPEFLELGECFIYPIVGTASSGKSNLLRLFMKETALQKWESIVIDPQNKHKTFAEKTEMTHVSNVQEMYDETKKLFLEVEKRNKKNKEYGPFFIFIDDLSRFYELLNEPLLKEKRVTGFWRTLLEKGKDLGIYFFITIDSQHNYNLSGPEGLTQIIKQHCSQGIFLGGNLSDDRWFNFDYQAYKSVRYNLEYKHGKGIALMIHPSGMTRDNIVKIPLVEI